MLHLLAPLLVLFPVANPQDVTRQDESQGVTVHLVAASNAMSRPAESGLLPLQPIGDNAGARLPQQVSIEQRVTIRVAPRPAPMPIMPPMFEQDGTASGPRFVERKYGKCVPIGAIAGVQPVSGRKLLLIMRDQRMLTAELEKGCQARDFYSGFLVAKNADGMICKERDELRARSGSTCQVSGFRQIIEQGG